MNSKDVVVVVVDARRKEGNELDAIEEVGDAEDGRGENRGMKKWIDAANKYSMVRPLRNSILLPIHHPHHRPHEYYLANSPRQTQDYNSAPAPD